MGQGKTDWSGKYGTENGAKRVGIIMVVVLLSGTTYNDKEVKLSVEIPLYGRPFPSPDSVGPGLHAYR
jgi:hypothetical protein